MKDAELRETVISREQLFRGKILDVQKWTVRLPDGGEALREVALHKGAAAVVPVDADGCTYLVRQYRVPFDEILTEIPAGKLDFEGEDRLDAAKRELREETGFSADKWTHLTDMVSSPGFTNELIGIYMAEGLKSGQTDPDEDEFLELVKMPLSEAAALARAGKFTDAKTIIGLLLADACLSI